MASKQPPIPEPAASPRLAARWRWTISLLLILHLVAIFVAPLHFASTMTDPGRESSLAASLRELFLPYLQFAYLGHGYAFFAPDPGASHLVRYEVHRENGPPVAGTMPDLDEKWPRLLYHRYFMMAEHLNLFFEPPEPPPFAEEGTPLYYRWLERRTIYENLRASYEQHLLSQYDGERVVLTRVEHWPPAYFDFREGKRLDAPDLFRDLPESIPMMGAPR